MNYVRILLLLLLIPIQAAWSKDYVVKLGQDRVVVKEYPGNLIPTGFLQKKEFKKP